MEFKTGDKVQLVKHGSTINGIIEFHDSLKKSEVLVRYDSYNNLSLDTESYKNKWFFNLEELYKTGSSEGITSIKHKYGTSSEYNSICFEYDKSYPQET